jgi:hypothetical protein
MASIGACINKLVNARLMTQAQGANLATLYQQMVQAGVAQPQQAAIAAARSAAQRQRYLAALQAQFIADLSRKALSHPDGVGAGVNSILATDLTGKASWTNVDVAQRAIAQNYFAQIAEALDAMRFRGLGFIQDRALIDDIVRELFGHATGNAPAARFAAAVKKVLEDMRVRFNEAGGDIPFRADYGMPQKHNALRIAKAGLQAWKAFIAPRLKRSAMLNQFGIPMTNAELDAALNEVFETITTNGVNKLVPGVPGGKKLANAHQDHRFLVFDDADKWLEYDREFGGGNPFFTIVEHIRRMSDDIALLEIMGPNPTQAFRVLKDLAKKGGVEGLDLQMITARWMDVSGDLMGQTPVSLRAQEVHAASLNALTSMRLASAFLSSFSDVSFMRQAAAWNGLDQARLMGEFLAQLNPANATHRMEAAKAAANADEWTHFASHAHRFSDVTGTGVTARMADLTMRISGMNLWTGAARRAVAMEFLMTAAQNARKGFAGLDEDFRRALEMGGVTAADWDIIRKATKIRANGVEMIDVERLYNDPAIPRADRVRVTRALTTAQEIIVGKAIPSPDANTRAITNLFGAPGTAGNLAAKSVLQFKSFSISVIQQHLLYGIHKGISGGALSYLASLTVATTVMGALSLQLKEISKGRTPMKQDAKFWLQAFFQGGGAGIFGDFVQSGLFGVNRFGGSFAETLAGPSVGVVTDIARATTGQLGRALDEKDPNFEQSVIGKLGSYTPIVGSLWYARVPYERWVVNQLQEEFDPKARRRWRAEERRRRKEFGQESWWRKGEMTPEAAPIEF